MEIESIAALQACLNILVFSQRHDVSRGSYCLLPKSEKPLQQAPCQVWLAKLWIGGDYSSWQTIQHDRLAVITQIMLHESLCF